MFCRTVALFFYIVPCLAAYNEFYCIDHGYTPNNGYRTPPVTDQPFFGGTRIHYHCNDGYVLNTSFTYQTCTELRTGYYWTPSVPPGCTKLQGCESLSVENGKTLFGPFQEGDIIRIDQVVCLDGYEPDYSVNATECTNATWSNQLSCTSTGSTIISTSTVSAMYCPKPEAIENGIILCCEGMTHQNACCPYQGKVQFECESGYVLQNGLPEMKCFWNGQWAPIEPNAPAQYPVCVPVESTTAAVTHPNALKLSDDMIRTVIGVAAGVLSLLLLVIILAFCKPKLKDIKRRWRDMREDENGLIVNGQRVVLPSYEEATSCTEQLWFDSYNRVGSVPPPLNSLAPPLQRDVQVTRPPESNLNSDVTMPVVGERVLLDEAPGSSALAFEDSFLSFFDPPAPPSFPAQRTGTESPDSACALLPAPEFSSNRCEVEIAPGDRLPDFHDNAECGSSVTQQAAIEESRDVGEQSESGSVLNRFLVSGEAPSEVTSSTIVLTSSDQLHTDSTSV